MPAFAAASGGLRGVLPVFNPLADAAVDWFGDACAVATVADGVKALPRFPRVYVVLNAAGSEPWVTFHAGVPVCVSSSGRAVRTVVFGGSCGSVPLGLSPSSWVWPCRCWSPVRVHGRAGVARSGACGRCAVVRTLVREIGCRLPRERAAGAVPFGPA